MYRLLAIAKYEDRFVIPTSHKEDYIDTYRAQGEAGFSDACSGCSLAPDHAQIMQAHTDGKTTQEMYEESFYGGIWRD